MTCITVGTASPRAPSCPVKASRTGQSTWQQRLAGQCCPQHPPERCCPAARLACLHALSHLTGDGFAAQPPALSHSARLVLEKARSASLVREQRTPVLSGPLYWLLQSSVLTATDRCLLSSPCHQKSHDERAVFLYGTSIHFFRHELGIAYFFGSERGIVRRFQRLFGDFVLISFRSYNGILTW